MIRLVFIPMIFFWGWLFPSELQSQCAVKNNAFSPGEQFSFKASYNLGFIWIGAGTITFTTENVNNNGKETLHITCTGKSFPTYDWFFKVRDNFETWLDPPSLIPFEFRQNSNEGGSITKNHYLYDQAKNAVAITSENSGKPSSTKTLSLNNCSRDILAACYVARNMDYSKCKPGDLFPVSVLINDVAYPLHYKFCGKEIVEDDEGNRYRCLKISALLVEGTIFKGGEDLLVWITDDENKIPVMAEAKILVGFVKAFLTGYKGLRHKLTSQVR